MNIKKLIAGLAAVSVLLMFTSTALAAEAVDETETEPLPTRTMAVSVEDITAVMEQLEEYDKELDMLARLVYAEARGVDSKAEQAAVIWCALNRADAGYASGTISSVVRARSQFAYSSRLPVKEVFRSLAEDVVIRWLLEKRGVAYVGRVLPSNYLYFAGRNGHNWFRKTYRSSNYWDWSLPDPYEEPSIAAIPAA
jgi:hypothetical protein